MVIKYCIPKLWLTYDGPALVTELAEAKATIMSLMSIPYQRAWADALQKIELKREVAGTSRIEGADFTERELDDAIRDETAGEHLTRSQRQARSATAAYRHIASLPEDRPVDATLIKNIHRIIVTGCDDDHCPPGQLRGSDQNVTFGMPRHRGASGGGECQTAFDGLCAALQGEFRNHDLTIQAIALHYHLGAMHPFLDGNGRTARALEALLLRRTGLKDDLFIAMSNYYYDQKTEYLETLSNTRQNGHDLTAFLKFGLRGIALQGQHLLGQIRKELEKSLFRDVMGRMYGRLTSTRKRALAARQMAILNVLLEEEEPMDLFKLIDRILSEYQSLRAPTKALARDLSHLKLLRAINLETEKNNLSVSARLAWATEITETDFFREIDKLPQAKLQIPPRR